MTLLLKSKAVLQQQECWREEIEKQIVLGRKKKRLFAKPDDVNPV